MNLTSFVLVKAKKNYCSALRNLKMKKDRNLPPKWVKLFSWCFAYLNVIPLMVITQLIFLGDTHGLSAYGFSLEDNHDLLPFTLVISGVLLLGGLTGIFILTRRSYAYDFGVFYCLCALLSIFYGRISNMPTPEGGESGESVLLLLFLVHLCRRRKLWFSQTNKETPKLVVSSF